jgi:hypothetical protein
MLAWQGSATEEEAMKAWLVLALVASTLLAETVGPIRR